MNTQIKNELNSLTLNLISEEARELSIKLQKTVYVVRSNNTLYTTLLKEYGEILRAYNLGNQIK